MSVPLIVVNGRNLPSVYPWQSLSVCYDNRNMVGIRDHQGYTGGIPLPFTSWNVLMMPLHFIWQLMITKIQLECLDDGCHYILPDYLIHFQTQPEKLVRIIYNIAIFYTWVTWLYEGHFQIQLEILVRIIYNTTMFHIW